MYLNSKISKNALFYNDGVYSVFWVIQNKSVRGEVSILLYENLSIYLYQKMTVQSYSLQRAKSTP